MSFFGGSRAVLNEQSSAWETARTLKGIGDQRAQMYILEGGLLRMQYATNPPVTIANLAGTGPALATVVTGAIFQWVAPAAPEGYILCDGREVSAADFPALFALIGTTFGEGSAAGTFRLPNLAGRVPVGAGVPDFNDVWNGSLSVGGKGGSVGVELSGHHLPEHNHAINASSLAHSHTIPEHNHAVTGIVVASHTHSLDFSTSDPYDSATNTQGTLSHDHGIDLDATMTSGPMVQEDTTGDEEGDSWVASGLDHTHAPSLTNTSGGDDLVIGGYANDGATPSTTHAGAISEDLAVDHNLSLTNNLSVDTANLTASHNIAAVNNLDASHNITTATNLSASHNLDATLRNAADLANDGGDDNLLIGGYANDGATPSTTNAGAIDTNLNVDHNFSISDTLSVSQDDVADGVSSSITTSSDHVSDESIFGDATWLYYQEGDTYLGDTYFMNFGPENFARNPGWSNEAHSHDVDHTTIASTTEHSHALNGSVTLAGDIGLVDLDIPHHEHALEGLDHTHDVSLDENIDVLISGGVSINGTVGINGGVTIGGDVGITGEVSIAGDAGLGGDISLSGSINNVDLDVASHEHALEALDHNHTIDISNSLAITDGSASWDLGHAHSITLDSSSDTTASTELNHYHQLDGGSTGGYDGLAASTGVGLAGTMPDSGELTTSTVNIGAGATTQMSGSPIPEKVEVVQPYIILHYIIKT